MLQRWIISVIGAALLGPTAIAQLDETWTLNANGQVGRPSLDGSFEINNIPGLDQNGDGWGEDLIRLTGISTAGGITRYVHSNYFQVRSGQVIRLSDLTFDFRPPPPS